MKSLPYDVVAWHIAKPLPGSNWWYKWVQNKDIREIDYDRFHFLEIKNVLEYTEGKRTIKLPIDAFREHFYRPRQMLRYLKYWVHTFHLSQSLLPFRRIFLEQRLY